MPRIQFEVHPPADWLIDLSESYPDDVFRVLSSYPGEDACMWIIEVQTENQVQIIEELTEIEELHALREIGTNEEVLLVECRGPEDEGARLMALSGIAPQYPTVLRNGTVTGTLNISHDQLSDLTTIFESEGIEYTVRSLVQSPTSDDLLTARQRQFIEKAITHGYYETPRRCTLTEIASKMEVHKTTASDVLHRAESNIITEFIGAQP